MDIDQKLHLNTRFIHITSLSNFITLIVVYHTHTGCVRNNHPSDNMGYLPPKTANAARKSGGIGCFGIRVFKTPLRFLPERT